MKTCRWLALVVLCLVIPATARADVVTLKNGGKFEGRISRETDHEIVVVIGKGKVFLSRDEIASIERGAVAAEGPAWPGSDAPAASTVPPGAVAVWGAAVTVSARGAGIFGMSVTLESRATSSLSVFLPAGCYFAAREWSNPKQPQDMLSVEDVTVELPARGRVEVAVPVASARLSRRIPDSTDLFDLARPNSRELETLAQALRGERDPSVRQAAVWIVSDDANYDALGILGTTACDSPVPSRSIRTQQAARAMRLVDEAGIDVRRRRIWQDRELLLYALAPEPALVDRERLRRWARAHWDQLGYPGDLVALLERVLADRSAAVAVHEEVFRIAAREQLHDLVPALERCLIEEPALADNSADDAPASLLASLQVDAIDVRGGRGGQPAIPGRALQVHASSAGDVARVDQLLGLLRSGTPEEQDAAVRELEHAGTGIRGSGERQRIAQALLAHARDRVTGYAGVAQVGSALKQYRDVLALNEVLALSRESRTGFNGRPVARLVAANVLAVFSEQEASDRLVELLADRDEVVRGRAGQSLGCNRENAQPGLRRLLAASAEPEVRRASIQAMLTPCPAGSVQECAVVQALADADEEVRLTAVRILGAAQSQAAIRPLIAALGGSQVSTRLEREIVAALIQIGAPALPAIGEELARAESPALERAREGIENGR